MDWSRVWSRLGVTYHRDGTPSTEAPARSRYERGRFGVSPRLDEDLDELRRRIDALEERRDEEQP